jgi:hypothetical protein
MSLAGDLVVTKGDQYDVREKEGEKDVRNLGKPVDLAARWAFCCLRLFGVVGLLPKGGLRWCV